jgi:hypothetical protein
VKWRITLRLVIEKFFVIGEASATDKLAIEVAAVDLKSRHVDPLRHKSVSP